MWLFRQPQRTPNEAGMSRIRGLEVRIMTGEVVPMRRTRGRSGCVVYIIPVGVLLYLYHRLSNPKASRYSAYDKVKRGGCQR